MADSIMATDSLKLDFGEMQNADGERLQTDDWLGAKMLNKNKKLQTYCHYANANILPYALHCPIRAVLKLLLCCNY
jgi:hypothetical protein